MDIGSVVVKKKRSKSFAKLQGEPLIACIDMGTNSFHMIVCQATAERDHFTVISRVKEAAPFFRRALVNHFIDNSAMSSTLRILSDMKNKAVRKGAKTILAVATSAVREANNGEDVLSKVRAELDIDARMISGHEEARLIYLGVLWSMPFLEGDFAIVDIGGGSTEIIVGNRHATRFSGSYKLGAARLTQRFFRKETPSAYEVKELHEEVQGVLRPAAAAVNSSGGFKQLVGTSGTVQALAKLQRIKQNKMHANTNGYRLTLNNLEEIVAHLEVAFLKGERIKEISSDRSRTILAGSIVLLEVMRSFSASDVVVCDAALREGVVVDQFLQTGWLRGHLEEHRDPRSESVHALLEKYKSSVAHAEQVAGLALQIFCATKESKLHDYSSQIGHLLWSAAMLHDVGMFIDRNGHHKHSYYLIKHGGLLGHSEEEVAIIASIARYHRGSEPKETHESFNTIVLSQRRMVTDMAAILRLAEALDRSHCQVVQKVSFDVGPMLKAKDGKKTMLLLIYVRKGSNWEPETWALKEKKFLFEKQFQVKLIYEIRIDSRSLLVSG